MGTMESHMNYVIPSHAHTHTRNLCGASWTGLSALAFTATRPRAVETVVADDRIPMPMLNLL